MLDKIFLQRSYANIVGNELEGFNVQSLNPYKANFRCPICGDSHKNKFKKRAYFLEKNNSLLFYCHNQCGSMGFETFLNDHFNDLYTQYKFDIIQQWKNDNVKQNKQVIWPKVDLKIEKCIVKKDNGLLYNVDLTDIGKQYLINRHIDECYWGDIYETKHFFKYINNIIPNKFKKSIEDNIDHRLLFPMRTKFGKVFGVIGRSLDKNNQVRYLTVKFDDEPPKIFGWDRLDYSKLGYIVEGPIDSLFVDNCIAFAGTDGDPLNVFDKKTDCVIILDNQPRSKDVIKKYEKYISLGYRMVIWPDNIVEKDINDMILSGMAKNELNNIIKDRTFSNLLLKIEFNKWKKI